MQPIHIACFTLYIIYTCVYNSPIRNRLRLNYNELIATKYITIQLLAP